MRYVMMRAAAVLALGVGMSACATSNVVSTAPPPIQVCGHNLQIGESGLPLLSAHSGQTVRANVRGVLAIVIKFNTGCQSGAQVTVSPRDAIHVLAVARAGDGRPAAETISLRPEFKSANITVHSLNHRSEVFVVSR